MRMLAIGATLCLGLLASVTSTMAQVSTPASTRPDATPDVDVGSRVEVEGRYGVTVPAGWQYELEDVTTGDSDPGRLRRILGFAPNLYLGAGQGTREVCRIEYGPNDGSSLESIVEEGQAHPKFEFEYEYVDLPADRALLMTWRDTHDGVDVDLAGYVVVHGETRVQIWCAAPVAPVDDWLSIAETFEFLSVES
jgi:hypothetical protein